MRVQFTVTNTEYAELQQLAAAAGYPDVPSYCRDISLKVRTYAEMWKEITEKMAAMPSGKQVALRDLIKTPPANLGRKLYDNQSLLSIKVNSKKDALHTNTFIKL